MQILGHNVWAGVLLSGLFFIPSAVTQICEDPKKKMSTSKCKSAIVIGAGPAGLSASLALVNKGVCDMIYLVERNKEFAKRGSNFSIAPNGLKALKEIEPKVVSDLYTVGISGSQGGLLLIWWEMQDVLLRHVRNHEKITLYNGEIMTDIVDETVDNGVKVMFESGLVLEGDFVVGADGVHSTVRKLLGLPDSADPGNTLFRGNLVVDKETASERLKSLLNNGDIVPFPPRVYDGTFVAVFSYDSKYAGRMTWIVSTKQDVDSTTTPLTLLNETVVTNPEEYSILREIFQFSQPEHINKPYPPTCVMDLSNEFLNSLKSLQHYSWGGRGNVTLLGDAAHGMRPTNGQGGNMAFEDAVMLYRTLLNDDEPIPALLARFEESRLPRVKKIHDDQREKYQISISGKPVPKWTEEFRTWVFDGI